MRRSKDGSGGNRQARQTKQDEHGQAEERTTAFTATTFAWNEVVKKKPTRTNERPTASEKELHGQHGAITSKTVFTPKPSAAASGTGSAGATNWPPLEPTQMFSIRGGRAKMSVAETLAERMRRADQAKTVPRVLTQPVILKRMPEHKSASNQVAPKAKANVSPSKALNDQEAKEVTESSEGMAAKENDPIECETRKFTEEEREQIRQLRRLRRRALKDKKRKEKEQQKRELIYQPKTR
jgi:hypothetical protein